MKNKVLYNIEFKDESAYVQTAINNGLDGIRLMPISQEGAKNEVKKYFPAIGDTNGEILRKCAIIRCLRRNEGFTESVEEEIRRQWLRQSIDIFQMLLESNSIDSALDNGLRFEPTELEAHLEFMRRCKKFKGKPYFDIEQIKWDIVDMFYSEVDLYG
jgi:hypothetical protein